jgi:hypothetical protein
MRARVFLWTVLAAQLYFVVRGYWDPHKRFAFQMFHEASRWEAHVVRVTRDGKRVPVEKEWHGYRWSRLVRCCGLDHPRGMRHARRGIDSTLAYLRHAMDWVADHTPADPDTLYYEAKATYVRNGRGPFEVVLQSKRRFAE